MTNVNGVEAIHFSYKHVCQFRLPPFLGALDSAVPSIAPSLLFVVHWFSPVNILLGINGLGDETIIQMIRQGELDKNSVDLGVIVQSMDLGQQLELADSRGQVEELKVHSGLSNDHQRQGKFGMLCF